MKRSIIIYLLVLVLAACSNSAQPTTTPIPTKTFTAVTAPTTTLTATDTPLPPTATLATASEWNGIPIMPEARTGEGDEESYVFTIQATLQQVRGYYELEMSKRGWQLSIEGDGVTSLMLTFTKESETFTVDMIAKGDEVLVLLVKQGPEN